MPFPETEHKQTPPLNPVENLFNGILNKIFPYIDQSAVKPKEKNEEGICGIIYNFSDNKTSWSIGYSFFKPKSPSDLNFEVVIETDEILSWIKPVRMTLQLFANCTTHIVIKKTPNNITLKSTEINDQETLDDQLKIQSVKDVFSAFPDLGIVSLLPR